MTARRTFRYPVAVLAFNRPDYLAAVLDSLVAQSWSIDQQRVIVHRDGYPGSSDESRDWRDRTDETDEVISRVLPAAVVLRSSGNIGIARAYDVVERAVFALPDAEWALFLEEDLVLAPGYLETMDHLIAEAHPRADVVAVSASGDTFVERSRGDDTYYPMHFAWGVAVRRSHWVRSRPYLDAYLGAVPGSYGDRDHDAIYAALAPMGVFPVWSAQDAVKEGIRRRLGAVAITTGAAHGRYIGEVGEMFTPEMYAKKGLGDRPVVDPARVWGEPLTDEVLRAIRDEAEVSFAMRATRVLVAGRTAERRRITALQRRIRELEVRVAKPRRRWWARGR